VNEIDVQVVFARFPSLSKHAAKLVEIYCALCPHGTTNGDESDEDDSDDSTSADFLKKYLHHISRPISSRCDIQFFTLFTKSGLLTNSSGPEVCSGLVVAYSNVLVTCGV